MTIADFAVRRPVATSCLIIGLTLLGLNAFRKMGLELMPKIDIPYITVVTVYPGASPEELEIDVAKRIEDAVSSIEGLKHVSSVCMENVCQTLLEFEMGVDVDIAATDVREKIDLIRSELPEDVEDPIIQKFDINAKPVATMALIGDVPIDELYDYADNELRDRLTVIQGVADVQLIGGAKREVHLELDRDKLAARGLTTMDVVKAVQSGVKTIPAGRIREGGTEYSVKFDADYETIAGLNGLEIANQEGRRCYLRDVGRAILATEEVRQRATLDNKPCIAIKVVKKADANPVAVANAVKKAIDRLNRELPAGMKLIWVSDDATFIEAMNADAWKNVAIGIVLTAAILFFFLYEIRSLLIVSITMPLTIIIGLFFMQAIGYTLNTSTLIAIGLSVGILVTNSIVVLEAIIKRLDELGDPKEAARLGANEVFIAVLASAVTNVVVLFPLAVMKTRVGLFIAPLAMTMFILTLVSLFISFTLTPMLCSLILKPRTGQRRSLLRRLAEAFDRFLAANVAVYRQLLRFTEHYPVVGALVLLAVVGMLVHSFWVAGKLGTGFFTETDRGEVYVRLEFPTYYDLAATTAKIQEAEDRLKDVPELKHILTTIGKAEAVLGQSSEGVYLGQMLLVFSQRTERKQTIYELMDIVNHRLQNFPDARIVVSQASLIGGQSTPVEMEISGQDLRELDQLALASLRVAREIPGVLSPDTSVRDPKPEIRIRPRRPILADIQSPAVGLGLTLRGNLEGIKAGTFKSRQTARNYDIVVKFKEEEGKDQVAGFLFPGAEGHAVILATLGTVEERRVPIQIVRKDKQRIAKVTAQLAPDLPLGKAAQLISQEVDRQVQMPPGYRYNFGGIYETMQEGLGGLFEAFIISVVLVFLSLAAIIESFKRTFLVLVTVPLALIGTFWALGLTGQSLDIFAVMGIVMMTGIVVNNAILIVDQFNILLAQGVPRHQAMIQAACDRFRPIVMITLAAVLGMLPLALGRGIGAEPRVGVGVATVGGILVSGVLTQIVIPILYDVATRAGNNSRTAAA
ncbi:RND multidrug efflux transporter, Acriflavin resistance protein [Thermogutta terrifontis]|uniref:RND multidrug efflux transporter, Acriflavin resistance protein n=1 Tax=Thermogutta terrifontis TaxID=1331910 RepID=A0A286RLB6_9BACT|nr:efflux RND transporter permease subunit [Thermogutta terrifontis]ASV76741.1 RND multidrug efflux transporter, Acriflavin resistance protein [Thermogutta terrifontis]